MASKTFDKLIEEIGSMTLLELDEFVKAIETKFNVSAAMPMMAGGAAPAAAAETKAEEKSEYKVTLKESGPEKMKTIKALRQVLPQLGLIEAKTAVENAPSVVAPNASKDDAKKIKEALEAAGAKVELS